MMLSFRKAESYSYCLSPLNIFDGGPLINQEIAEWAQTFFLYDRGVCRYVVRREKVI